MCRSVVGGNLDRSEVVIVQHLFGSGRGKRDGVVVFCALVYWLPCDFAAKACATVADVLVGEAINADHSRSALSHDASTGVS